MADRCEHDQQEESDSEAPPDEFLLNRQQRLVRSFSQLGRDVGLRHGCAPNNGQLASGGLTPLKNSQEISKPTQITNPNRLTT